jgi:dihydropteroate synthase/2-amino-4-hydroxy-6-hydroxymethyldihydropteridine diphosphokinase
MGVVNVTPDSFSDGGAWYGADAAIAHGLELAAQGADIVDVGGESTRPGAQRVDAEEELRRIAPVITALVQEKLHVSVDTMRASVAEFALNAGVHLVNDVSGGLADSDMPRLVASAGVPYVVVHWRGHSEDMYSRAVYRDVVAEVRDELARRVDEVMKAGVEADCVVLDPGLGFGKRHEHNWPLLARIPEIARLNGRTFPVLVGASRKGFIGGLLAGPDGTRRPFAAGDDATVALTALAAASGAWCVRVHKVPPNVDAVRVAAAWRAARNSAPAGNSSSVVLAIGANLGDRLGTLREAVTAIGQLPDTEVTAVSPVYQTAPVGGPQQPDYLNAVLLARTGLPPGDLLNRLHEIEAGLGRVREVRFGPRTLDIDIVSYAGQVSDDPVLTLPHPRARERAFVLAPWRDLDPEAVLPGEYGGRVADLLAEIPRDGVRRLPERLW